ncbi:hypothetical protein QNH99_23260 (plasmid) [Pantoea allii]|uniref:hypothetical protein n=1 Tax=Pantoea allii TaxID=574096 RepID=UPI00397787D7
MFKINDPFTFSVSGKLTAASNTVGFFITDYTAAHYDDLKLSSGTSSSGILSEGTRQYILSCTQRINIYNPHGSELRPEKEINFYDNYPVLLNTFMEISEDENIEVELIEYSPQTVNTVVQSSSTNGESSGKTSGNSNSQTVGSTTSQTNSFSASVGFSGEMPTASVTAESSLTKSQEFSSTNNSEQSRTSSTDNSSSASMSIKDWGSYSFINPETKSPGWTFGQEYPWDAITFRKTTGRIYDKNPDQTQMILPDGMRLRLYDGVSLYPPSHLSMFGFNFVMKCQWKVVIKNNVSDIVSLQHFINYFTASHLLESSGDEVVSVQVYRDDSPTVLSSDERGTLSNEIDLGIVALSPVSFQSGAAVVGFLPSKFTVKPAPYVNNSSPVNFRIFSAANNLRVTDITQYTPNGPAGAGFSTSNTGLRAVMLDGCKALTLSVVFKVTDETSDYALFIKHWKNTMDGIRLDITINGDKQNTLIKFVDAYESEGGENNVLSINLRNLDILSNDYHDYLSMGLNSIEIYISPLNQVSADYQIRAISVEES